MQATAYTQIQYKSDQTILCSILKDGFLVKKNSGFRQTIFHLLGNAILILYRKSFFTGDLIEYHRFNITTIVFEKIELDDGDLDEDTRGHIALNAKCVDLHGTHSGFRAIFPTDSLCDSFLSAVSQISSTHNVPAFRANLSSERIGAEGAAPKKYWKISIMRRGIHRVVDKAEKRSIKEIIRSRREVFHWLPVAFTNDLIHGSFWFVFGSMFTTICAIVVVANAAKQDDLIGDDYSVLNAEAYVSTWILITFSGAFYTIGSLFFVRAMSEPAMRPLFYNWYHLSTDELAASWMFFVGTFMLLPYSLIYLAEEGTKLFVLLVLAILCALFAQYIWTKQCYPQEQDVPVDDTRLLRMMEFLCCARCFGPSKFWRKHFANDWLSVCWIIFYITLFASIFLFFYTIYEYYQHRHPLSTFINVTTTIDAFIFLIGSFYFVAGSYPPFIRLEERLNEFPGNTALESQADRDDEYGLGGPLVNRVAK